MSTEKKLRQRPAILEDHCWREGSNECLAAVQAVRRLHRVRRVVEGDLENDLSRDLALGDGLSPGLDHFKVWVFHDVQVQEMLPHPKVGVLIVYVHSKQLPDLSGSTKGQQGQVVHLPRNRQDGLPVGGCSKVPTLIRKPLVREEREAAWGCPARC